MSQMLTTKEPRLMKLGGFIFLGLGVGLLGLTAVIAYAIGEPPERIKGIALGAIFTVVGLVQLVRWRMAVARGAATD